MYSMHLSALKIGPLPIGSVASYCTMLTPKMESLNDLTCVDLVVERG